MDQGVGPALQVRDILHVVRKWKALMALVVVVAVGTTGVLTTFVLPQVYRATATVNVDETMSPAAQTVSSTDGGLQGVVQSVDRVPVATMQTDEWEATSPAVMQGAAANLSAQGIQVDAGALAAMMSTGNVPGTNLLTVSATNHDPRVAAAIANAAAQAFVAYLHQNVQGQLGSGLKLLQQQAQQVDTQLQTAQGKLANDQTQPGASADTTAEVTADTQELGTLSAQLDQAKVSLRAAAAADATLRARLAGVPQTVSTTTAVSADTNSTPSPNPAYATLQSRLQAQQVQVAEDQAKVDQLKAQLPNGPTQGTDPQQLSALQTNLVQAETNLNSDQAGQGVLAAQLAATPQVLQTTAASPTVTVQPNPLYQTLEQEFQAKDVELATAQATVDELQGQLTTLQTTLQELQRQLTPAQAAVAADQSQIANLKATADTLQAQITQNQIQQAAASTGDQARVDAPAGVPGRPISPKRQVDIGLALLLGLVVATGLAFLLEQLDNTVKSMDDVLRITGLPTLAVVPLVRR